MSGVAAEPGPVDRFKLMARLPRAMVGACGSHGGGAALAPGFPCGQVYSRGNPWASAPAPVWRPQGVVQA